MKNEPPPWISIDLSPGAPRAFATVSSAARLSCASAPNGQNSRTAVNRDTSVRISDLLEFRGWLATAEDRRPRYCTLSRHVVDRAIAGRRMCRERFVRTSGREWRASGHRLTASHRSGGSHEPQYDRNMEDREMVSTKDVLDNHLKSFSKG